MAESAHSWLIKAGLLRQVGGYHLDLRIAASDSTIGPFWSLSSTPIGTQGTGKIRETRGQAYDQLRYVTTKEKCPVA